MQIPEELKYTVEHEWIRVDGDVATIGITDYAQDQLGDIVFVELPQAGDACESMGVFGTVEAVKTVADLFSPMSGEIAEVNTDLEGHPEYVNEDPYNKGWMIKLTLSNPDDVNQLLTAQAYKELIGE